MLRPLLKQGELAIFTYTITSLTAQNMKFSVIYGYFFVSLSLIILLFTSCKGSTKGKSMTSTTENPATAKPLSKAFRNYWYSGKAEITSYSLQQARYGELRDGQGVLVFVTEPFEPTKQVKADRPDDRSKSVLKLNASRKFLTGIYPYSIMSSTFYPVSDNQHALKVSNSVQEWCGQVYTQLNNRDQFELRAFSYFESEGDQELQLPKSTLENELWAKIRIDPQGLPQGEFKALPALEFIRLKHLPFQSYNAKGTLEEGEDLSTYTLDYPELDRTLRIQFRTAFPYEIENWEETYRDGFGPGAQKLTTRADRINRINSPYWSQNSNSDGYLRDTLGLR